MSITSLPLTLVILTMLPRLSVIECRTFFTSIEDRRRLLAIDAFVLPNISLSDSSAAATESSASAGH